MAKAIGAKMLKKQLEKEAIKQKAKTAALNKVGALTQNQGEFLDRAKQKFDVTKAIKNLDSDAFGEKRAEVDKNPKYTAAITMLCKRKDQFFLTMNESMIDQVD